MRKITRRKFLQAAAVTAVAAGAAACSSSSESTTTTTSTSTTTTTDSTASSEPVTLSIWHGAADETRIDWWDNLCADFNAAHDNITIEALGISGTASDLATKLDMNLAAGEAPDMINSSMQTSYITRGILEKMDEYWDSWEGNVNIDEKYLASFRAQDTENGYLYGMPRGGNVEVIYIRPDLFEAAGLDASLETWEDFFSAVEVLTDKDQGIYSYIIRGGSSSPSALAMEMYSYSGVENTFIDGVCTINNEKNVEFVERFLGGYKTYTSEEDLTKSWTEMAAQFQSGKAAMLIHNLGSAAANYAAFDDDTSKVLAVPYPKNDNGTRMLPTVSPDGHMMLASCEHKAEAWEFLQFLMDPEQDGAYHQMMSNLPINSVSLSQDWVQSVSYMKMGAEQALDSASQFCPVPYYLPNYSTIQSSVIEPAVQSTMLGDMTAQEMLDVWAAEYQADYDAL